MTRFILLAIVPIVILISICLICKYTGFNIIPKELRTKGFKFPKIKRTPSGWVAENDKENEYGSDDENEVDYEDSDDENEVYYESENPPEDYDSDIEEFTKPLKKSQRKKIRKRKPTRIKSNLSVSPNDPIYRVLNGGLYD